MQSLEKLKRKRRRKKSQSLLKSIRSATKLRVEDFKLGENIPLQRGNEQNVEWYVYISRHI